MQPEDCTERVLSSDSARVLRFPELIELLASETQTSMGAAGVGRLQPLVELAAIEHRQQEVEELRQLVARSGWLALRPATSLDEVISRAAIAGTVLDTDELLQVARMAGVGLEVRKYLAVVEPTSLLGRQLESMPDLVPLARQIARLLDDEGEVRDEASPMLAKLRRQRRGLSRRIRRRLEVLCHDPDVQSSLQEPLVTERGGRYVLPVRSERRDRLPGIVHDSSSSRQTVYVEPLELVEEQNRCALLQREAGAEVARLLAEATAHVRAASRSLRVTQENVGHLDLLQALARYAETVGAVRPRFGNSGICLRGARHPLMDPTVQTTLRGLRAAANDSNDGRAVICSDRGPDSYVPLDLELDCQQHALVITGPNTGGKTVVLTTLGLVAAMAQSGVPVPVAEAQLPLFPRLHADIGDEQSIVANLSTFSGHLVRILAFLSDCPSGSLVMIDELGTGTDPAEGSALGIALLEQFQQLGAMVLVSTHHDALKAFAHGQPGATNACMEFDTETLAPTYRLLIGRPGRSNALEIATRLGLPAGLATRARSLLQGDTIQLDALLQRLEEQSREVLETGQQLRQERRAVDESMALQAAAQERLRQQYDDLQRLGDRKIQEVVEQLRTHGEDKMAELESRLDTPVSVRSRDDRRARWKAVTAGLDAQARSSLRQGLSGLGTSTRPAPVHESTTTSDARSFIHSIDAQLGRSVEEDMQPLRRGDGVVVKPFDLRGTVLMDWTPTECKPTEVEIDVGGKRLIVARERVARARGVASGSVGGTTVPASRELSEELHLRGCAVDEALALADKYVDDALLAELPSVRLIHGHGEGRLRKALWEWLPTRRGVIDFAAAEPGEGGSGVTMVYLKV